MTLPVGLHELERELRADAEREVRLALRVSVLLAAGHSQAQMRNQLGISSAEMRLVLARIRAAAGRLREVRPPQMAVDEEPTR